VVLNVVAAAVLHNEHLLVVSKHAAPDLFYLPGGKADPGEQERDTLSRELSEEVGARPIEAVPYLVIEAMAALEQIPMRLSVYRCALSSPPQPAGEISHVGWTSGADSYVQRLATAIRDVLVPQLRQDALLVRR
jgi:8-oxo-dGTP diphosphatase